MQSHQNIARVDIEEMHSVEWQDFLHIRIIFGRFVKLVLGRDTTGELKYYYVKLDNCCQNRQMHNSFKVNCI